MAKKVKAWALLSQERHLEDVRRGPPTKTMHWSNMFERSSIVLDFRH